MDIIYIHVNAYILRYICTCMYCVHSFRGFRILPGQYPMYVVPFEYFMNMRSVKSHQELLSSKILVEFVPELLGELLEVLKNPKTFRDFSQWKIVRLLYAKLVFGWLKHRSCLDQFHESSRSYFTTLWISSISAGVCTKNVNRNKYIYIYIITLA